MLVKPLVITPHSLRTSVRCEARIDLRGHSRFEELLQNARYTYGWVDIASTHTHAHVIAAAGSHTYNLSGTPREMRGYQLN